FHRYQGTMLVEHVEQYSRSEDEQTQEAHGLTPTDGKGEPGEDQSGHGHAHRNGGLSPTYGQPPDRPGQPARGPIAAQWANRSKPRSGKEQQERSTRIPNGQEEQGQRSAYGEETQKDHRPHTQPIHQDSGGVRRHSAPQTDGRGQHTKLGLA